MAHRLMRGNGPSATFGQGGDQISAEFFSDWRTATGRSQNAVGDGGKWADVTGPDLGEVVASTGLDFPTRNVFKCISFEGVFTQFFLNTLSVPGVGTTRYYRWYARVVVADDEPHNDVEFHPHQDGGSIGSSNWALLVYINDNQGAPADHWTPALTMTEQYNAPHLPKHETFRFELDLNRTATTEYVPAARIYDSSDVLLYDSDDWMNFGGAGAMTGDEMSISNLSAWGQFSFGINGLDGQVNPEVVMMYTGGVAISDEGPPGPYGGVEGEDDFA